MIEINKLTKSYIIGGVSSMILKGIDLKIEDGDFVAIMGPSGSGKSTLMNMIGILDIPTSGEYLFQGINVAKFSEDEQAIFRRDKIGFIFQGYNLLAKLTAWEQVALPLSYKGWSYSKRKQRAIEVLCDVGLSDKIDHTPDMLSGGQQIMQSWRNLRSNKMRSFLSILGLVIGVFSVTVMVSVGEGLQSQILGQFSEATKNTITIIAGKSFNPFEAQRNTEIQGFTDSDMAFFKESMGFITNITPIAELSETVKIKGEKVDGIRIIAGSKEYIDILLQFLTESVLLGILGCILGVLLSRGVIILLQKFSVPALLNLKTILIAVLFAGGTGIIFGVGPARKAAKMKPIDALRYE